MTASEAAVQTSTEAGVEKNYIWYFLKSFFAETSFSRRRELFLMKNFCLKMVLVH